MAANILRHPFVSRLPGWNRLRMTQVTQVTQKSRSSRARSTGECGGGRTSPQATEAEDEKTEGRKGVGFIRVSNPVFKASYGRPDISRTGVPQKQGWAPEGRLHHLNQGGPGAL